MPASRKGRGFYVGLAIGQLWLAVIATVGASIARVIGRTPVQTVAILVAVAVVGLGLVGAAGFLLRLALRLPPGEAEEAAKGRAIGLRFGLVFFIDVVVIAALNLALIRTGNGDWIVPVTYLVVGLHFFPLAFVFGVRPYLLLGALWVLVVVVTVLTTAPSADAGEGLSPWIVLPIAGCGVVTWAIVGYVVVDALRTLRFGHRHPASSPPSKPGPHMPAG